MATPLHDLIRHDYAALALAVFLEAVGLPLPAAFALVAAGAACAAHNMVAAEAMPLAIAAMLLGDGLLYVAGRLSGWWFLGILCRISLNPEGCILRSAESFYRRGRLTLIFAKFLPGVNTMAPPLAGSMRLPFWRFLRLDLVGALLYGGGYFLLGYLFGGVINAMYHRMQAVAGVMKWLLLVAAVAYILYRVVVYARHRHADVAPRITAAALATRLQANPEQVLIADVRSHGYYDRGTMRIKGSIRLDPSTAIVAASLPRDREIYLYCT